MKKSTLHTAIFATAALASSTKPTRSRSRTLVRTTAMREEFSRSIFTGPSTTSSVATWLSGMA